MRKAKIFSTIFVAAIALYCISCNKKIEQAAPQKPVILVSIAPYQFLAERIAGEDFTVRAVVPPGANPHAYEPTSKQVTSIGQGSVWFRIGEPFEKKVLAVLKERNPALVDSDLRRGINLIGGGTCCGGHEDRHIWLSPKLAAAQSEEIERVLSEKFPESRDRFAENGKTLREELFALDREIASLLESVKDRVLLVSHPAFGYFCRDYDFEQLSVEFEGKDPRPRHLEEVVAQAIRQSAELALSLPQHNNKGAQLIAERLHIPVRMIDPYSHDYFETLRLLAHLIADPQYQR
jgi:zinc transport system substrate-binding protein